MKKIITRFINWLNKPYSYREEFFFQITIPFIIGLNVFLILYLLKPFGLGMVENNHFYYFLGYGGITTLVILLFFFLLAPLFPVYFSDNTWTVKKEILTLSSIIFVIGICAWFYHHNIAFSNFDAKEFTFLKFLKYTFSLCIFPVIFYVYFSESFLANTRLESSKDIKKRISFKKKKQTTKEIELFATNQKDKITFLIENLVYIKSEGNYASIYLKEDSLKEKILRVQLKVIENKLKKFSEIIRCHKSYVVNTNFVNNISGNARGYYLHLSEESILIPVSRRFTKKQLEALIS